MGVGLYVLGKPIMALIFPSLTAELAGPLLSTLGLATVFVCMMLVCNSILQAYGFVNLPVIIMLVLAVGNIMNVGYEKVLLMQNDLNLNYSEIVSTYVYKVGLASGITDFSLSTAIGMFNSVINFILLIIANWGSKKLNGSGIF